MNLLMMNMMVEKNKKKYCCDRYLPLKKEKCAYEKVQAKNILEKKAQARYEREETAKQRQLELEANQKQLEAGKRTMEQIMNWDLD